MIQVLSHNLTHNHRRQQQQQQQQKENQQHQQQDSASSASPTRSRNNPTYPPPRLDSSDRPTPNMSRRRSARIAFEEEGGGGGEEKENSGDAHSTRPGKRAKTLHSTATSSSAEPTVNGTAPKKATRGVGRPPSKQKQAAYDEDADGFQFSRPKKPKPAAAAPSAKESVNGDDSEKTDAAAVKKGARKSGSRKKDSLDPASSTTTTTTTTTQEQPSRRRSARLSGDKVESSRQAPRSPPAARTEKNDSTSKTQTVPTAAAAATTEDTPPRRGRERERIARTPQHGNELNVAKKRGGPMKIALPFADTPVMARNKELRKSSAESARRSSSTMRGRRASDLIDRGSSNDASSSPAPKRTITLLPLRSMAHNRPTSPKQGRSHQETQDDSNALRPKPAVPHHEVDSTEFYKHISQDLSEQRRMKQLLTWCGTRALPPKKQPTSTSTSSSSPEDINNVLAARVIQEELLRDFSNKPDMSNWLVREDNAPVSLLRRPNPRNQQNAHKLIELQEEVKRLEAERATWDGLLAGLTASTEAGKRFVEAEEAKEKEKEAPQDPSSSSSSSSSSSTAIKMIDEQALADAHQTSILQALASIAQEDEDIAARTRQRVATALQPLEFKIDVFADAVHRVGQTKQDVQDTSRRILQDAAAVLEKRHQEGVQRAGMDKVGVGDVLRTLSRLPPLASSSSTAAAAATSTST